MKNFGQIKNVLLIGGGYLMYYFAKIAKERELSMWCIGIIRDYTAGHHTTKDLKFQLEIILAY